MEVENLTLRFNQKPLFEQISFKLERGKIHRLKGKNGSGKSTLFKLLQGEIPQGAIVSGKLNIGGKVACVAQDYDAMLVDVLTFEENLRSALLPPFPIAWRPLPKTKPLPDFLERFGIDLHRPVHFLSGGQRQILALLMVLQKEPQFLLLDEPTAALDSFNARLVFEFLQEFVKKNGVTLFVICHDEELSIAYCDGVIVTIP